MGRKAKPITPAQQTTPATIDPQTIYRPHHLQRLLGLPRLTVVTEIRAGRLRHARVGRMNFIMGEWVLAWIGQREATRRKPPAD